ncbi:hypothetical protein CTAYLR_007369 [Chrysophaeum taylorii]|uniref:Autophagy-related protein 2 n=1 Tax=Chrysophaeum taylorii TaxID=2483200 RepID=A0AAD7U6H8_9STRA|nr:hypothetical protein CTAYLR_007369 [Chrysophaeum taylorii]
MWGLRTVLGKVLSVMTRVVLNRVLRRYLKQRLRRVIVCVSEGRIELMDVVLDARVLRSLRVSRFVVESCSVGRLELVGPRLATLLRRKPSGCSVRLSGVQISGRIEEEEVVVASAEKKEVWRSPAVVAVLAWLDERVARHSEVRAEGTEMEVAHPCGHRVVGRCSSVRVFPKTTTTTTTTDPNISRDLLAGRDVFERRAAVSWEGLSWRVGRDRLELPGGYARLGPGAHGKNNNITLMAAVVHLNAPRVTVTVPSDAASLLMFRGSSSSSSSAGSGGAIAASVSVTGAATVDARRDEDRAVARFEGARCEWDPSAASFCSDIRLDGPVRGSASGVRIEARGGAPVGVTASSPLSFSCDDARRLGEWIRGVAECVPAWVEAPASASTRGVRVECGGVEARLESVRASVSRPRFSSSETGDWVAEAARVDFRACDDAIALSATSSSSSSSSFSSDGSCGVAFRAPSSYEALAAKVSAAVDLDAYEGALAELEKLVGYVGEPFLASAPRDADEAFEVVAKIGVVEATGGDAAEASLATVEYRLGAEGDSLSVASARCEGFGCRFEARGADSRARIVSDDEKDELSSGAAFEIRRDSSRSTVSALARRGSIRLAPPPGGSSSSSSSKKPRPAFLDDESVSLRAYVALYDCEVEYAPIGDLEGSVRVGFARFGAMLGGGRVAVCSTRVRDLELDVLDRRHAPSRKGDDRRARLATLDVFDAVSKTDRAASSILVTSGTLRLYACHDSLQSLVDLAAALARDCAASETVDPSLDDDDGDDEDEDDASSTLGGERCRQISETDDAAASRSLDVEASRLLVEDYVPKGGNSREEPFCCSDEEPFCRSDDAAEPTTSRLVVPADDDEMIELETIADDVCRSSRGLSRDTDENDRSEDEDDQEPAAAWYAAEDMKTATVLYHEHFQQHPSFGAEDDELDDIVDEEPEFRFELRSAAACFRLFAGSEWEYAAPAEKTTTTTTTKPANQILASLLVLDETVDDETAAAAERPQNRKRRRKRSGRNIDKLCEASGAGVRIRFARPRSSRERFRLEAAVGDFRVVESVSTESGALRPALEHWRSDARHPRQTKDPMLRIVAHGVEDDDRTTTRAKLRLLPLRCRLDAEFVRFVDAFFGTIDARDLADEPRRRARADAARREDDAVWVEDDLAPSIQPRPPRRPGGPVSRKRGGFEAALAVLEVAPWKLKLDYVPRALDANALRRGSLSELLHLFALERVELDLRRCRASAPTLAGALDRVRTAWATELRDEQLHRFVAGAEPVRPIAAIGASAVDVLAAPVADLAAKGDRARPLRQLSKSAATLGAVAAFETARASRKVATKLADAIDAALPDRRAHPARKRDAPPRDAREGVERARDALERGLHGATDACAALVNRPSAATLAAAFPVAILQPVVGATRGIAWILLGLEAAMENDDDDLPVLFRRTRTTRRRRLTS